MKEMTNASIKNISAQSDVISLNQGDTVTSNKTLTLLEPKKCKLDSAIYTFSKSELNSIDKNILKVFTVSNSEDN